MIKLNEKALEFINGLKASRALGFDDMTILPHAWLESGGFKHIIGNYNCWGIKVPRRTPWTGPVHYVQTTEFSKALPDETPAAAHPRLVKLWGRTDLTIIALIKGMWKIGLPQGFIDFANQQAAIAWYCDFIKRLYPISFNASKDPIQYFYGLIGRVPTTKTTSAGAAYQSMEYQQGRLVYATDPNYVEELIFCKNALAADSNIQEAIRATMQPKGYPCTSTNLITT